MSVGAVLVVVVFSAFSMFPEQTNAGMVSSLVAGVSNLFKSTADEVSAAASPAVNSNSQKLKILEAPLAPRPSVRGGEIAIVDDTALAPVDDASDGEIIHPANGQISVYVVHKGDTLSQIAKMYDVSVNTIVWANDLGNKPIGEGQTLVILPVSGVRHIVKAGDTIASIAKKYKGDVKEIVAFNNLSENQKLTTGDEIIVPDGETQSTPTSSTKPGSSPSTAARFANLPLYQGYYANPAPGSHKTQGIHGYNGVDLGAPIGTPVLAAAAGTVIISRGSGWNGGYGSYVVIFHANGTQTLYGHLSKVVAVQGSRVEQGQLIGNVGSTGKSTGPHLHFEVRGARNPF